MPLRKISLFLFVVSAAAQAPISRVVHVTVTDPQNRYVTGLGREVFQIVENGMPRPITGFSDVDAPVALAIVGATDSIFNREGDEVIQAASVADAVRLLSASKAARKILVSTEAADTGQIPAGVEFVQAEPGLLRKTIVEARNRYLLEFQSTGSQSGVDVVLHPQRGLPPLRANLR